MKSMEHLDHVARIQQQWAAERPDLDPTPQGIIGRLHRLAIFLREDICTVYADHGLTEAEFDVLATLRRSGEPYCLAPSELAAQTMVTSGATTKRLDRLVSAGYVERQSADGDQRRRRISLTAAGKTKIDEVMTDHLDNEARLIAQLSPTQQSALEDALKGWLKHYESPQG